MRTINVLFLRQKICTDPFLYLGKMKEYVKLREVQHTLDVDGQTLLNCITYCYKLLTTMGYTIAYI